MTPADLKELLEFARGMTVKLIDTIAKEPAPQAVLAWRPGPGRAPIAWQLMHLAATEDRHLNTRMKGTPEAEPEYVRRFAGGSTPDDDTPSLEEIKRYLAQRREALTAHLMTLSEADLATKPNEQAQWAYGPWFRLLAWHEAHHQGQAHLTLNLYRAAHAQS